MGMSIGSNPYGSLFSSMNGRYNAASEMSNLIGQKSQIANGSYSKLMKAYVGKVGNKAALDAYRTTGSTASSATDLAADKKESASSSTSTAKEVQASKAQKYSKYQSSWLDSHLNQRVTANKATAAAANASGTEGASAEAQTDAYAAYRSSWLDDHLKSYNSAGTKTMNASADPIAIDAGV